MVFDNIEATFEFDPCTNYLETPRLPVQYVSRQQYEVVILGPIPIQWNYQTFCFSSDEYTLVASGLYGHLNIF